MMQSNDFQPSIVMRVEPLAPNTPSLIIDSISTNNSAAEAPVATPHADILTLHGARGSCSQEEIDEDDDFELEEIVAKRAIAISDNYLRDQNGRNDTCTLAEADEHRKRLNKIGPVQFLSEAIDEGSHSAQKLTTAFRYRVPTSLEGAPDDACFEYLVYAIGRYLSRRFKLPQYNTVDDAASLIKKSQNIIVITGAGISTSLGIPDFRSAGGLYQQLKEEGIEVDDPQQVFDIHYFREAPHVFFGVAKKILIPCSRVSPTHAFIKMLHDHGKLLTNYTQNIDNLEALAGIPDSKVIQCHGSFKSATCQKCYNKVPAIEVNNTILSGQIPQCKKCLNTEKSDLKRKRSDDAGRMPKKRRNGAFSDESEEDDQDLPEPIMKPDITFFGEELPDDFHKRLTLHDKDLVDLVIVIGTSLQVAPVSHIPSFIDKDIPQIYISREIVRHTDFDIELLGECDVICAELSKRSGMDLRHEMLLENQIVNIRTQEEFPFRHAFSVKGSGS